MAANELGMSRVGRLVENSAEKARRERRRALIVPREHGAWGLLLVPMVTGAGVAFRQGDRVVPFLLLLTLGLTLFWLRTPVESLLGTSAMRAQTKEERITVALVIAVLGKVAIVCSAVLLWAGRNRGLWFLGGMAVLAFVAQALLKQWGRPTRMLSEVVGTMGLTLAAPAAYYVTTGRLDATAWILWFANLIFAGNQIHYVQLRIHTAKVEGFGTKFARGWGFAAGQCVMAAVLAIACWRELMPWPALLAFTPILLRGWLYFFKKAEPLQVRRLGWSEMGQAAVFCVLLVTAFGIA